MCDISEYWRCVLEAKGHKINLGLRPKIVKVLRSFKY